MKRVLALFCALWLVQSKTIEINTAAAYLFPSYVQQLVELSLTVNPATTIPQDGSFSFTFPAEYPLDMIPQGCILQQPPIIMSARCNFNSTSGRLVMNVTGFDMPISNFFQVALQNFMSPRSTTPYSSFEFYSFDQNGDKKKVLDLQRSNILAQATDYDQLHTLKLGSSSEIVADQNQTLRVTLESGLNFKRTDGLHLIVPKWNPKAGISAESFFESPITCIMLVGPIAPSNCYLIEGDNFDTVVIPSFQVHVPPRSIISFSVGPFINPINTQLQPGFQIFVLDQYDGISLENDGFLQISQPSLVPSKNSRLIVNDTLITNQASFELSVNLAVPLDKGCQIKIKIPDLLIIGKELTTIELGGSLGGMIEADFTFEPDKRQLVIQNACSDYRPNVGPAIITISAMQNPGYVIQTDSFQVFFGTAENYPISHTTGGMTFTTTPGTIEIGEWSATNYLVSSSQELTMRFQPRHEASQHTKIVVTLPKQDLTIPQSCLISDYNYLVNSQGMDCSANITSNSVAFTDLIFDSFKYKNGGKFIEVAIFNVTMPSSIRPTGVYTIDFYDLVGTTYRLVDSASFTNLIQAESGELGQVNILASQNSTWVIDTLTISFVATHEVLQGGWIEMIVPAELQVQDNSVCINLFNANATCLFQGILRNTIRIINGFDSNSSQAGFMVSFQVTNVRTQRSTKPSTTFKLRTLDSSGFEIDTHNYFKMSPAATKKLQYFTLKQFNSVVGGESSILVSLKSPVPIFAQDSLIVTFPSDDMAQQLAFTYTSCSGTKHLVRDALNCVLSGLDTLVVQMEFSSTILVRADTEIQFNITNVANPTSTKPSESLDLQLKDQYGFEIISTTTDDTDEKQKFRLKASSPADLIFASVVPESTVAYATTAFTFTIVTRYQLPPHSNINIVIPSQIGTVKDQITCWTSSRPEINVDCQLNENTLVLFDINGNNIVGGTTLQIEIQGLVNSKSSDLSDSFTVTTLTDQWHLVDSSSSGLQVSSSCNYPCNSCPLNKPSVCRKCTTNQASLYPLYYDGTCLDTCPSHFFPIGQVCSQCDQGCLECAGASKQCTKCAAGFYLLGTVCMDFCPDNYYSNPDQRLCDPCKLPCETCSQSTSHCTSCSQAQPLKAFFQNQCYDSCPVGPSVFSQGECLACTPDCLTCSDSFDTCKTCRSGKQSFLDFTSYHCVDQCPAKISVATVFSDQSQHQQLKTCEKCDVTCKTCDPVDKNQCTKCATGLKFNEADRKCLKSCPPRTAELYIPVAEDFICVQCKQGCSECSYQKTQCTACDPGLVFFQYDCLAQCPEGFKTVSETELVCVRDGEVCDFGYAHNSTGQCALIVPHCQIGYVLNSKDDLCIPVPGVHVPGLFLGVAIAWTTIVLVMRFLTDKNMPTGQLVNQLLVGLITIQQIAYYAMFFLSFQLNYSFVVLLHLIGFIVGFIINAAALIYSFVMLPKDLPFKHWKDKNLKVTYVITAATMAISYKLLRGLTCGIMKRDWLLAVFQDKFRNFTRPIIVMTAVGFVLQVAPIAYINVYTLIQIPVWGYEIRTLGIESLILACVIVALEIYDYLLQLKGEKELPRVSQLMLQPKSKKQVTFKVMSGFDESNDQQNLIKQSQNTVSSQVDLLENLNKQIIEKQRHKGLESRFDDKALDQNNGLMTIKEKREYIAEKRQNFECFRYEPKKTFEGVADLCMGKKFIHEPNNEVIQHVGFHFKKIKPVKRDRSAIDFYEYRSDTEVDRDTKEFEIHLAGCDAHIKRDQRKKDRLAESFDDEYLRDFYDDFGVCSDFESQLSWISYPPQNSKLFQDPYLMAKASLLSEKIKYKFQYNNVETDFLPVKVIIPKLDFPSRKTQTCVNTITSDPFESSQESVEDSSGRFSAVDSKIAKRIFADVYEGQTDSNYLNSARSRVSKVKVSIDSHDLNIVAIGSSKKRPRRQTSFLHKSIDSSQELQKQHIQPVPVMQPIIDIEVNDDYDEEAQIANEIHRLKSNLSMDMAGSIKGNGSFKSASEEGERENHLIGQDTRFGRGGRKKLRDRMMIRAYLPDDAQLQYLNMHYPENRDSLSVSNKKHLPKAIEIQENNLKINKQSTSDNLSSAIDTATEGANAARTVSLEQNQIKDNFTHTAWDESGTSGSQRNLLGLQTVGIASSQTFDLHASVKKEERKVFNKFEHGYLFDFKQPQSAKKMINGVEYLPPVPFRKRQDKPFRSNKTKLMEMERGKNQTVGFEKLQELESVYLGSRNGGNDTRMSSFVHQKIKPSRPTTASVERGAALMQHRNLRKQNFMEDGKELVKGRQGGTISADARRQLTNTSRVESRPESASLQHDLKIALERMGHIRLLEQERHQRLNEDQ